MTFGRPDLLRRAVASVKGQTFEEFTHIIVEDAGNEPSIQNMGFTGVMLMTMQRRTGWPGFICRNEAATMAETEWIAFCDDDNWYDPNHLYALWQLQEQTHSDFVCGSTRLWTKAGEIIGVRRTQIPGTGKTDISEILCKRALFVGSGGLDPRDGAPGDGRMVDRWIRAGARWAHTNAVTLNYTVNDPGDATFLRDACVKGIHGHSLEEYAVA